MSIQAALSSGTAMDSGTFKLLAILHDFMNGSNIFPLKQLQRQHPVLLLDPLAYQWLRQKSILCAISRGNYPYKKTAGTLRKKECLQSSGACSYIKGTFIF
jgi:hypothetical protein